MRKTIISFLLMFLFRIIFSFEYSFLNNTESLTFTRELLAANGILQKNINIWGDMLRNYNAKIDFINDTENGWMESDNLSDFSDNFINGGKYYVNCRTGIFMLIRDLADIDRFKRNSILSDVISQELSKMNSFYEPQLTEKEQNLYKILFNPVTIPRGEVNESLISNTLNLYRTWWEKEGLNFAENRNLSIIQVIIVTTGGVAFSDHTALLINENSIFYLIEKRSPRDPFMISIHSDERSVLAYLYEDWREDEEIGIIILKNEESIFEKIND